MPIGYWFGHFIAFAMYVFVIYRTIRVTATAYRQARYWKTVAFSVVTATLIIYMLAKVWLNALLHDLSLVYTVPAALIGACLGLVIIWLERRYYPDA